MSEKRTLLFSKREKADKSTSMGQETENNQAILGAPQNNQKETTSKKKKKNKSDSQNQEKTDNDNQIERTSNAYLKNTSNNKLANLKNENLKLNQQFETLSTEMEKEREKFINEIKEKDEQYAKINSQMKKLSIKFKKNLEVLKEYEKNLKIKSKENPKSKGKSEEEIKNEINIIEKQIKTYGERAIAYKQEYEEKEKKCKEEEEKEEDLKKKLDNLNNKINPLEEKVNELKKILLVHQDCNANNEKLIELYNSLNRSYQYELKRAKNLALTEIKEGFDYDSEKEKEEKEGDKKDNQKEKKIKHQRKNLKNYSKISNAKGNEDKNKNSDDNKQKEEEEKDTQENANNDMKIVLPKIQDLKFSVSSPMGKLDIKILKKNKIGINNNSQRNMNAINLYQKLSNEYKDNERYINDANKNIRIVKMKKNHLKTEENHLFNDNEAKMMEKVLSPDIFKSCQEKFNNALKDKKDIQKKFDESREIKNGNLKIINDKDFTKLKLKEMEIKKTLLEKRYRTLVAKVNDTKKNIKNLENLIKKEDEKIKKRENERKRIEIYFKGLNEIRNKTNNNQQNNNNNDNGEENEENEQGEEENAQNET